MAGFDLILVTACRRQRKKALISTEELKAMTDCRLMGISGLRAVLYKGCWHQRSIITVFYVGLDEFKQPAEVLAAMYTVQANLPNRSCVSH